MTITPTEIAVALGRPIPDPGSTEDQQWSMWISDALMLISARLVGDATDQVASLEDLDQTKLDYVVREAVAAQVRRPDDATSVDVRVDDGAVAKTYRSSSGRVTIRDEWWALLSPDSGYSAGAFSIRPHGSGTCHSDICSANVYIADNGAVMFGGAYCSCGADIAGYPLYEV